MLPCAAILARAAAMLAVDYVDIINSMHHSSMRQYSCTWQHLADSKTAWWFKHYDDDK
jgi:hypothetical protein